MPVTSSRSALRSALLKSSPLKSTKMQISTEEGPMTILITEPTFKERNAIESICVTYVPGSGGAKDVQRKVDAEKLCLQLLLRLVKGEDGLPLFDLADAEVINSLPSTSEVISRVLPEAIKLFGGSVSEEGNSQSPPVSSAA